MKITLPFLATLVSLAHISFARPVLGPERDQTGVAVLADVAEATHQQLPRDVAPLPKGLPDIPLLGLGKTLSGLAGGLPVIGGLSGGLTGDGGGLSGLTGNLPGVGEVTESVGGLGGVTENLPVTGGLLSRGEDSGSELEPPTGAIEKAVENVVGGASLGALLNGVNNVSRK